MTCRRGGIERHRDVVDEGEAHQRLHVDVMRVRRQGVDEEEQGVDPALRDHGADLLVAAQRTTLHRRDYQDG